MGEVHVKESFSWYKRGKESHCSLCWRFRICFALSNCATAIACAAYHKGDFRLEVSSPSLGSFGGLDLHSPHIQAWGQGNHFQLQRFPAWQKRWVAGGCSEDSLPPTSGASFVEEELILSLGDQWGGSRSFIADFGIGPYVSIHSQCSLFPILRYFERVLAGGVHTMDWRV